MAEGIVARGKKTVIRWFERKDADQRDQWPKHSDPLYSHNDPRSMSSRERDLWFLDRSAASSYRMFAIDDIHGDMIGWITLRNINLEAGTSVLGIALHPAKMGQGCGTDAMVAFFESYFGSMGFKEMWLDVAAFNARAMRCYEKCGFRYVGQHWTEHPTSLFPSVFSDPRYRGVVQYFRRSLLGMEVLYYDMVADRSTFVRAKGVEGRDERAAERVERAATRRVTRW